MNKVIRNIDCKECPKNKREDIVWKKGFEDGREVERADKRFKAWLIEHEEYCKQINTYIHNYSTEELFHRHPRHCEDWNNIDRDKDHSLSSENFRFYLYLRLVEEHKYI